MLMAWTGEAPPSSALADPPPAGHPKSIFDVPGANASTRPIQRKSAPNAAAEAGILKRIKDANKPYPPSRPADRLRLSKTFVDRAADSRIAPDEEYVLLREASLLAAGAGSLDGAMSPLDTIEFGYSGDVTPLRLEALQRLRAAQPGADAAAQGAVIALALARSTLARGDYSAAARAGQLALSFATIAHDPELKRNIIPVAMEASRAKSEERRAAVAQQALTHHPDDPMQNLIAGQFLCLWRNDWARGLPLLAKGSDLQFKNAAARELAKPGTSTACAALGNQWWDIATQESGAIRARLLRHAAIWYERALPGLTGAPKASVQRRLDQAAKAQSADVLTAPPAPPR
jgi:hypothetical protein